MEWLLYQAVLRYQKGGKDLFMLLLKSTLPIDLAACLETSAHQHCSKFLKVFTFKIPLQGAFFFVTAPPFSLEHKYIFSQQVL